MIDLTLHQRNLTSNQNVIVNIVTWQQSTIDSAVRNTYNSCFSSSTVYFCTRLNFLLQDAQQTEVEWLKYKANDYYYQGHMMGSRRVSREIQSYKRVGK